MGKVADIKMIKRIFVVLVVICGMSAAGFFYYNEYLRDPILDRVGDFIIRRSDADYRSQVQKIYYPQNGENQGLAALQRYFGLANRLKSFGKPVLDAQLEIEMAQLMQNGDGDPTNFQKTLEVFGSNQEAFKRLFVLPKFVERTLEYEVFAKDLSIQGDSIREAMSLLTEAQKSKASLLEWAKGRNKNSRQYVLQTQRGFSALQIYFPGAKGDSIGFGGPSGGITSSNYSSNSGDGSVPATALEESAAAQQHLSRYIINNSRLLEFLPTMKADEFLPGLYDNGGEWVILKFIRKLDTNRYLFEGIGHPKLSFQEWIHQVP